MHAYCTDYMERRDGGSALSGANTGLAGSGLLLASSIALQHRPAAGLKKALHEEEQRSTIEACKPSTDAKLDHKHMAGATARFDAKPFLTLGDVERGWLIHPVDPFFPPYSICTTWHDCRLTHGRRPGQGREETGTRAEVSARPPFFAWVSS